MKKSVLVCCFLVFGLFLWPAQVFSAGITLNEMGAKAVGMGGAFAAQADDPTAVYYNPAGITQLEGTQAALGIAVLMPSATFQSDSDNPIVGSVAGKTTDARNNTFYIPNAFVTQKITDKLSLGLGAFTNFGLTSEWPDTWEGRFITGGVKSEVTSNTINPVIAYKFQDGISVAAGPVLQYMSISLANKQFLGLGMPEADVLFEGDGWGWGWNAAMLVPLADTLKLGLTYRSAVHHALDSCKFTIGEPVSAKSTGDLDISLPAMAYAGLAWNVKPVTLEFDVQWTQWSAWDTMYLHLPDLQTTKELTKNFDDAFTYRLGVNWAVTEMFDIRAGAAYSDAIVPAQTVDMAIPGGDRWTYNLGVGGHFGNLTADLAYVYVTDSNYTFDNAVGDYFAAPLPHLGRVTGTFKDESAHIGMLTLSYRF